MRKRTYLLAMVFVAALLAATLPLSTVLAHTELVSADPPSGAELSTAPSEIRLTFNEPIGPGSTLAIYGEHFEQVPGVSATVNRDDPEQMVATVPPLGPGTYTVQWAAEGEDGHEVTGSYSFSVKTRAAIVSLTKSPWALAFGGTLAVALLAGWVWRRAAG
jgi:methionine-rich copper-binding protein CopC